MTWRQGGAYALLGPSRLRQDHAAQHHLRPGARRRAARSCSTACDVTPLSTQKRNIAQVFQFPVIYDTMTVGRQSGLPAANRGVPRGARSTRGCSEIAEMLDLTPYLEPQGDAA